MHKLHSRLILVQELAAEFRRDQSFSIWDQEAELKKFPGAEGDVSIYKLVRKNAVTHVCPPFDRQHGLHDHAPPQSLLRVLSEPRRVIVFKTTRRR